MPHAQDLRGTAFGVYYFVIGIASLAASALAGALWGVGGAWVTFTVGAVLASLAVFSVYVGRSKVARRVAALEVARSRPSSTLRCRLPTDGTQTKSPIPVSPNRSMNARTSGRTRIRQMSP